MSPASDSTMSPEAYDRLAELLERYAGPRNGMNLEMLDGFLSALVVSPELVMPSEYFEQIFNGPVDWDMDDATETFSLIQTLWNSIVDRVSHEFDPEDDESFHRSLPLFALPGLEDEDEANASENPLDDIDPAFPYAAAWALGFMQGVALRPAAWEAWIQQHDDFRDDLDMVIVLSLFDPEQAAESGLEPEDLPDLTERFAMSIDIPAMLHEMYKQRLIDFRPELIRGDAVPGRNDLH